MIIDNHNFQAKGFFNSYTCSIANHSSSRQHTEIFLFIFPEKIWLKKWLIELYAWQTIHMKYQADFSQKNNMKKKKKKKNPECWHFKFEEEFYRLVNTVKVK